MAVTENEQLLRDLCRSVQQQVQEGSPAAVESVLDRHPELFDNAEAWLELIYAEYTAREESGQPPTLEELLSRFPQWRSRIERLLQVHLAFRDPEQPTAAISSTVSTVDLESKTIHRRREHRGGIVEQIGSYELHDLIGQGGMGLVYKAFQPALDRFVALKVIHKSAADPDSERRFLSEARAAAGLHHPHIVPVHDVGETPDCYYLTMELVEGGSLDRRLRTATLPAVEAARMLAKLAASIQYAHSKGVIHRDLKPGNVLLDEAEEPKLTDFGVARQLSVNSSGWTRPGIVLGTPSYMAPEQASGLSREIGPACDIYGLGAVLYEMLTGRPPFLGETPLETLQQVRGEEPVPPRRILRQLPRDLENICLKCLEKNPLHRYDSAEALGNDLQRFLRGEPVRARPLSTFSRFARRCRRYPAAAGLIATLSGVLLLLAVGGPWVAWSQSSLRKVAAEKAREAQSVTGFLVEALRGSDPRRDGGRVTIEERLDDALLLVEERFPDETPTKPLLLDALAQTLIGQGQYDKAVSVAKRAVQLRGTASDQSDVDTLRMQVTLGESLYEAGHFHEARQLLEAVHPLLIQVAGSTDVTTIKAVSILAAVHDAEGDHTQAVSLLEQTYGTCRSQLGDNDPRLTTLLIEFSVALRRAGQERRSLDMLEQQLDNANQRFGPDNMTTLELVSALAAAYRAMDQFDRAELLYKDSAQRLTARLGRDHPRSLTALNNLAAMLMTAGKYEESKTMCQEVLGLRRTALGPTHPLTLASQANLAAAYWFCNEPAPAREILEDLLTIHTERLGPDHVDTLETIERLGDVLGELGAWQESADLLEPAYNNCRRLFTTDFELTLSIADGLARAWSKLERLDKAIPLMEETVRHATGKYGPEHTISTSCTSALARMYAEDDRLPEALELQSRVVVARVASYGDLHPGTMTAKLDLACLQKQARDFESAEARLRELIAVSQPEQPSRSIVLRAKCELGEILAELDRLPEAIELLETGIRELEQLPEASLPGLQAHLKRYHASLVRTLSQER